MFGTFSRSAAVCIAMMFCLSRTANAQTGGSAATAGANDPAIEARAHFDRGLQLLDAENFDAALAEFERSHALNPRPSVLYNIGVTQQALRRYPEAARTLERYLHEGGTIAPARRAEVERTITQLRSLVARVTITVEPATGTVRLDGREVGPAPLAQAIEVGPGSHAVEVTRNGVPIAREEFSIASGENRTIRLAPVPEPSTSSGTATATSAGVADAQASGATVSGAATTTSPAQRPGHLDRPARGLGPAPFIALGAATVAFGGAALTTGILTLGARAEFDRLYADDPAITAVAQRGETFRLLTNVFLIGTGASAIATVIVLTQTRFAAPRAVASASIDPATGTALAMLRGTF